MNPEALLQSITISYNELFPIALKLVVGLLVLFLALIVAKWLGKLATIILKAIQVDALANFIGINKMLERANVRRSIPELLGDLIYWLTAVVSVVSILRIYGVEVQPALIKLFAYMGIVLIASLILGVGLFLAVVISSVVRVVLANLNLENSQTVSRTIYYVIVIFAFLAALSELGFNLNSLAPHLGVIIGFPALAAAIAFGLGCKDMAADFFHNLFKGR